MSEGTEVLRLMDYYIKGVIHLGELTNALQFHDLTPDQIHYLEP